MNRLRACLLLIAVFALPLTAQAAAPPAWFASSDGSEQVRLYFFWSSQCPHCLEARPFIESLPQQHSWLLVQSLQLIGQPQNLARFRDLAAQVGFVPSSVPTFVWCGQYMTGYHDDASTGQDLLRSLATCYREQYGHWPPEFEAPRDSGQSGEPAVYVPWLGALDPRAYSLPMLAVLLGALDAFNPCAFFVLLFLLSLLVNTRSRLRMLLVGGVFVAVSGLVYFAFMAAWLNLFQLVGQLSLVTLLAGIVALTLGLLNIKDYLRVQRGTSTSLSDGQKQRLFSRMRGLLNADRLPALLGATLVLAVVANSYELLCTMGLPMVFTRVLTLEELPVTQYYAYLALYNLVYVTPMLLIVGLFVLTMGRRKLSESEGRFFKLLSGSMMSALGLLLVTWPDLLASPVVAVAVILVAVLFSLLFDRVWRLRRNGD